MEMSGQLHIPATLPPEKEPLIPTGEETGWTPEPVWTRRYNVKMGIKSLIKT
jgi:hypothetical protein